MFEMKTLLILEFLKSENTRVQLAMNFVARCNAFSRQKTGGYKSAPSVPRVIGQSCIMCVTRGTCLGSSCLGNKGRLFLLYIVSGFITNCLSSSKSLQRIKTGLFS